MFIFYYIWGFFYVILNYTHNYIENFFLINNNPFLIRKRTFKFISFFEKLVLVFFYKKGWFEKTIANLYVKEDIINYRRKYYPTINSFHIIHDKVNFEILNLKFFVKQYLYFNNFYFNFDKLNFFLKLKNNDFIKFLLFQNLYFKKYYNLNNYFFFKNINLQNLIKFNKIFSIFLKNSNKKLIVFNLDLWNDWYNFNFDKNIIKYFNVKKKITKYQKKKILEFNNKKLKNWINLIIKYKKRLNNFNVFFKKKFKGIIYFKLNYNSFFKIKINKDYFNLLKYYIIKFSESSVTKHINSYNLKNYNFQFLRKNRIFNKGRYSRNRQLYRTGVYWCLWLNIIMVYGLYFIFYRFSFNFGYFWWGILVLAYSTIFSRISKYNFYNVNYLYKEFLNLINWYGFFFINLFKYLENILFSYFNNINIINYIINYKKKKQFFLINNSYYLFKLFKNFVNSKKKIKMIYIWQGMKEKDLSFFKHKTIIHWLNQFYKLIVT